MDYWPRRARRAATRGAGQRRTTSGSVPLLTSTPSPGASTTGSPAGRRTATLPLTTSTEVAPLATSTAHCVPRTAAIACGVTTWKPPACWLLSTSTKTALLRSDVLRADRDLGLDARLITHRFGRLHLAFTDHLIALDRAFHVNEIRPFAYIQNYFLKNKIKLYNNIL